MIVPPSFVDLTHKQRLFLSTVSVASTYPRSRRALLTSASVGSRSAPPSLGGVIHIASSRAAFSSTERKSASGKTSYPVLMQTLCSCESASAESGLFSQRQK